MRVLGIIPGRGGSKGVSKKNIQPLGGHPLIAHTIVAAQKSGRLTRTIVSTDDAEIAAIAKDFGGEVPFMRPAQLATDSARAILVLQHALNTIEGMGDAPYDAILMLQPTTPFRRAEDIDGALRLLAETGADSVISVVDVHAYHPARMKYLEGDRLVDSPFCEEYENQPRQELRPMYIRNGAIYAVRREVLLADSLKGTDCRAWLMNEARSVNIDTERDFLYAAWCLEQLSGSEA